MFMSLSNVSKRKAIYLILKIVHFSSNLKSNKSSGISFYLS